MSSSRRLFRRRAIAVLTLIAAAIVWVVVAELPRIVHARVADALSDVGIDASFRVSAVALDRIELSSLRAGDDVRIDRVVLRYAPAELLDGRIRAIEIVGARCTVREGTLDALEALASRSGGAGEDRLRISVARAVVRIEGGPTLRVSGEAAFPGGARLDATTEIGGAPVELAGVVLWPRGGFDLRAHSPALGSAHARGALAKAGDARVEDGSGERELDWQLEGSLAEGLVAHGVALDAGAEIRAAGTAAISTTGLSLHVAPGSTLRAREVSLEGGHRARDVRADLSGALTADRDRGVRTTGSLDLRAATVRLGQAGPDHHPVRLRHVRARATLDGGAPETARITARNVAWHGVDLGRASGSVTVRGGALSFSARCPLEATVARISGSIGRSGGRVRVVIPEGAVRRESPLGALVAELAGTPMTGHGGAEATIDLRTGAGRALIGFRSLRLAGIRFGRGGVELRMGRRGEVTVEDAVAELAGGRVRAAPFRIDTAEIVLSSVSVRGVRVRDVLTEASGGRWTGTGVFDGSVAFRIRGEAPHRRLILDGAHLQARQPGRMRVAQTEAVAGALPRTAHIGRRIASALRDFDYSALDLAVAKNPGMTSLVARVEGRGRRVPQELSMTLRVRNLQPLVDAAVRHAPPDDTRIRATWSSS